MSGPHPISYLFTMAKVTVVVMLRPRSCDSNAVLLSNRQPCRASCGLNTEQIGDVDGSMCARDDLCAYAHQQVLGISCQDCSIEKPTPARVFSDRIICSSAGNWADSSMSVLFNSRRSAHLRGHISNETAQICFLMWKPVLGS